MLVEVALDDDVRRPEGDRGDHGGVAGITLVNPQADIRIDRRAGIVDR